MKTIQSILTFVILGMVTALAQTEDAAPTAATSTTSNKVSNLEIEQLVHSTRLKEWSEIAKKSSFFSSKQKVVSRDKYGGVLTTGAPPIVRDWEDVYGNPASRPLRDGWQAERKQAELMLQRPGNDDQRKWLTRFVAACDALDKRDAKAFADLVPALVEDYRSLL